MTKKKPKIKDCFSLEKNDLKLPKLDLINFQKESYRWFLTEGIAELLVEVSPIEDFTGKNFSLEFLNHSFEKPNIDCQEAQKKGLTFDIRLKANAKLINKKTGKSQEAEVFLCDLPMMTDRGTFIINGIERCIINQLIRAPGVYFTGDIDQSSGRMLFMAEIRPIRGSWLEFNVSRNNVLTVRIDRRRKFPVTTFLRAVGISSDEEILKIFKNVDTHPKHRYIKTTIGKDSTKGTEGAVIDIFRKMRPGEPIVLENAQSFFHHLFFNPRRYNLSKIGRYKLNKKLNLIKENKKENWVLSKEDIIYALIYLINLQNNKFGYYVDNIDHLSNRRVRLVGELISNLSFRTGLLRLERAIKERMSFLDTKKIVSPTQLVNARPISAVINQFFRTSRLSAILDQTNPLSEIDNIRRLSVMGQGGISRERASFSIRDIHSSQYGRICPVRSPEGPNIGLVTYLTLYSRINEYGFLETPYRKVVKDEKQRVKVSHEIVYLNPDDEENYYITHSKIKIDENNYLLDERVPARYKGEFLETEKENIQFVDLTPRQVVGTAASLIPFLSHDEPNRALMGSNMQCQSVPLIKNQAPIIGTGLEGHIAESMGRVVRAKNDGKVSFVDSQKIIISHDKEKNKQDIYFLDKFKRTTQSTCFSQKPLVNLHDSVKKGQIIIDGPAAENGKLALGANLLIAYMSYDGLGYEDAIVISDRLVKEDILTSINIEEYEAVVVDTKLGPEETTRDIPNVGLEALANLDKDGIIIVGSEVGPNDILVGKIAPKGETELTAEERLLRAIFGEKAREVRDTSLRLPHGERGTVIEVSILDKEKGDEIEPGALKLIKVKVAQIRKITVGDKLAGRHGNKGVISKIVPVSDMPYLADGTAIDIIISPLSVLSRMNLGQLLESHLGWAASKLNKKITVPVFEEISEKNIQKELQKANLPLSSKTTLFDGRTGEPFKQEVSVGIAYIMKLTHMVEDKTHARSTGPYSLVTQQPLGGKAQMGGQRLGEMEVWALESHRAAYTLQEMLTIKSDDVIGRAKAFESIIKGAEINQSMIPEGFRVLIKELQSLCLAITPTKIVPAQTSDSE